MHVVIPWLCYLVAFGAGSAVARLLIVLIVRRTSRAEALAALPGPAEIGAS